jgi:prepilin-type N-terminal cleavage/methylation domain-containing protein
MKQNKRFELAQGGFTIVELLVVMAIMSALVAVGYTNIMSSRPNWEIKDAAADIAQSIQSGRYHSIKRNRLVIATPNLGIGTVETWFDISNDGVADEFIESADVNGNNSFFVSARDCANTVVSNFAFSPTGALKWINSDTSTGVMPIILIIDHQKTTSPDQLQVVIERSGVTRVASNYVPACAVAGGSGGAPPGGGSTTSGGGSSTSTSSTSGSGKGKL